MAEGLVAGVLAAVVAAVFQLPQGELARSTRRAPVALARQVGMYVAHVGLSASLTDAGRQFGRDRTTAAHACRRIEEFRDDPGFDRLVAGIEAVVTACRGTPLPGAAGAPLRSPRRRRRGAWR